MHAAAAAPVEPTPVSHWLEPVYRQHARAVLRTAHRITGSPADAEDVLHTVFLRLARREVALDPSQGPQAVLAYLRRAATNAALDLVGSARVRTSSPLEASPDQGPEDRSATPERQQLGRELETALRRAVAGLPRRAAEMFSLRYFEEVDNGEIARLFDTTPGTVAVTLHRARARLLDELSPYLGGTS